MPEIDDRALEAGVEAAMRIGIYSRLRAAAAAKEIILAYESAKAASAGEPTMQEMLSAFEAGRRQAQPGDEFAGDPTKWPEIRGLKAVRDLYRAMLSASPGYRG